MNVHLPLCAACMLSGILTYFADKNVTLFAILCAALLCLKITRIGVLFFFLGIGSAFMRSYLVEHEALQCNLWYQKVQGKVVSSKIIKGGTHIVVDHVYVSDEPLFQNNADRLQVKLFLRGQQKEYPNGCIISCKAHLFPLDTNNVYALLEYYNMFAARGLIKGKLSVIAEPTEPKDEKSLREMIYDNLQRNLQGEALGVALALITGHRNMIDAQMRRDFARAGVAHLLAISGLHMGLLGLCVMCLIRKMCALLFPIYDCKNFAICMSLAVLFVYLQISGGAVPAMRAFLMYAFMAMGALYDRDGISERAFAMSALCVMSLFPESVLGASFQMSFAAVGGIIAYFRGKCHESHLADFVLVSLITTCITAPFCIYHFRYFSLNGIVANCVMIPLMTFVVMPLLVISVPMLFVHEQMFAVIIGWCADTLLWWTKMFAQWPFAFNMPTMSTTAFALMGYAVICMCVGKKWSRYGKYLFVLGTLLYVLSIK